MSGCVANIFNTVIYYPAPYQPQELQGAEHVTHGISIGLRTGKEEEKSRRQKEKRQQKLMKRKEEMDKLGKDMRLKN